MSQLSLETIQQAVVAATLSSREALQYAKGDLPHALLQPYAALIKKISERYVNLNALALTAKEVAAYALYYLPVNAQKFSHLIINHILKGRVANSALRVLDYGCGPLTATLGACLAGVEISSLSAIDSNTEMIRLGKDIMLELGGPLSISTSISKQDKFDLVLVGNLLSELSDQQVRQTINKLLNCVLPGGYIVIVEPGMRETSRSLMTLRDTLANEHTEFSIRYPCTHHNRCPLIVHTQDWCHAELHCERTRLIRQLDALTGFNKHTVKYSALILERSAPEVCSSYRAITETKKERSFSQSFICGEKFSGLVKLSKRARSDTNRLFDRVQMHDLLQIEPGMRLPEILSSDSVVFVKE